MRNILTRVLKKNSTSFREAVKSIFRFTDLKLPCAVKDDLINKFMDNKRYEKACEILDDGFEDAFQYTVVAKGHSRLKSTNVIERLNQEVRRREKVVRIFPNTESAIRLIGAVLIDIHEEWIRSPRKYIKF